MSKVRKQRWIMVLEDRPEGKGDAFYTKDEILTQFSPDLIDLSIKSLKKETK